ncbi:MAG TPA: nucleotide-binding protein [Geobacteraceae bacterium]
MARKPTPVTLPKQPLELSISRDEAKTRLQDRIERGLELKKDQIGTRAAFDALSNEYSKWNAYNSELLKRIFTTDELAKEYDFWGIMSLSMNPSLGEQIAELYKDIDGKIHRIDSIIERLELIPLTKAMQSETTTTQQSSVQSRSKKVFVVHGRDEIAKTSLEVFLHEIGLEPIVLHRQADEGMTIIEKFEKHSDVGYAFILLTPDEIAYLASEETQPDELRNKEKRSRPNVIFEFGYFVGKLGRSRVCCLYTGNVTLPSDVSGMIYKRYENSIEEVAYGVIKDLKASGYTVA